MRALSRSRSSSPKRLQVSSVDRVVLGIQRNMLSADLMNLFARSSEQMQMHLRSTRIVEPPVSQVLVVHPLDTQDVVHRLARRHRDPHERNGLLPGQVRPVRDRLLLHDDQMPAIFAAIQREFRRNDLEVSILVTQRFPVSDISSQPSTARIEVQKKSS